VASTGQLDSLVIVRACSPTGEGSSADFFALPRTRSRKWWSYLRWLQGASEKRDKTGSDFSPADFTWCMTANSWGQGIKENAAHLTEESAKAREQRRNPLMTAQNAAAAVRRRERTHARRC
jgi:hypothetical protein